MKILMLGDYSNLHACLAAELRKRGHDVTLVSDRGGYMKTEADIALRRRPGPLGSVRYLWKILSFLPSWKGYDAVQLINPGFFSLKPGKLKMIYDILRRNNRSVFLTLCGNDHYFVKDCVATDLFRFSEFRIGKERTQLVREDPAREKGWLIPAHADYTRHLYDTIRGAMAVLPEYDMSARLHMDSDKVHFTNLPIDVGSLNPVPIPEEGPVRILVGMRGNMETQKGTARLLAICRSLASEMEGKVEVKAVRNLSLREYLKRLEESHIVIDQLYSYSPATNALQTMALGRITASGAQPEYYEYIGEKARPIFMLTPEEDDETIKSRLRDLVADRGRLSTMAEEGRRLVERHNDVRHIAPLFERIWKNALQQ